MYIAIRFHSFAFPFLFPFFDIRFSFLASLPWKLSPHFSRDVLPSFIRSLDSPPHPHSLAPTPKILHDLYFSHYKLPSNFSLLPHSLRHSTASFPSPVYNTPRAYSCSLRPYYTLPFMPSVHHLVFRASAFHPSPVYNIPPALTFPRCFLPPSLIFHT